MKKPVRPLRAALTLVLAASLLSVALAVWRQANPGTWNLPARVATLTSQTVAGHPTISQDAAVPGREPTPMPALSPTATAAPTATPLPTLTPTEMATPTIALTPALPPTPAPLHRAAQSAVTLAGLRHEWQTWNNCGPATLAMLMSFFGSQLDQATAGAALRLSADDKNVSPQELVAFARSQGYAADLYVNGSGELARTLLSNDIPVLIETWYEDEIKGGIGHYRLLTGYDDAQQQWIAYDSLDYSNLIPSDVYAGIHLPYDRGDALWKVFNRTYVLVYPPDRSPVVQSILGATSAPDAMWQAAADQARQELAADPNDLFAWFNLGSSLSAMGNYADAATAFDRARAIGLPPRMLWYQFEPFAAYLAVGRPADVLALADETLEAASSIEEIHFWRGRALAALGQIEAARSAFQQSLALNPTFAPAQEALSSLGE